MQDLMSSKFFWVEKYRPSTLTEYVFHSSKQRDMFEAIVESKQIPHLLLCGIRGSGKTTLARILTEQCGIDEMDVLTINASADRGIDTFRNDVRSFASTIPVNSPYKVIHLEEADQITPDAQKSLKSLMEDEAENVRFIFTCNQVAKIIPELRSRLQEHAFTAPKRDDAILRAAQILKAEGVKATPTALFSYVDAGYPDLRKVINLMQQHTADGMLLPLGTRGGSSYEEDVLNAIQQNDWVQARTILCAQVAPDQWEEVYRLLYTKINTISKFADQQKWDSAVVVIAEHLHRHAFAADPEICAVACLIQLSRI